MVGFASANLSCSSRDANKAADLLAKFVIDRETNVWFHNPPIFAGILGI
jgi:hypothetical protein